MPQRSDAGTRRKENPRVHVRSQRYTDPELKLLEQVAGGEVNDFIRDAAVDRARQFIDAGAELIDPEKEKRASVVARQAGVL